MHRRREFPSPVKRAAYTRSGGICECHLVRQIPTYRVGCGQRLSSGNTFYEHIAPDQLQGGNDIDNCAVLVKTCWKLKTASYDLPTIASNNRKRDRDRGIKPQDYAPMPGTKRSGIKLRMKPFGKPIDRETGREWRSR
jgi:hypothetical protein